MASTAIPQSCEVNTVEAKAACFVEPVFQGRLRQMVCKRHQAATSWAVCTGIPSSYV